MLLVQESAQQRLVEAILQITKEKKPATVNQLVEQAQTQIPSASQKGILETVISLHEEGKSRINAQLLPYPKTSSYFKSNKALWFWITLAATAAAIISAFTIPEDAYPLVVIRYFFGALLVLWLPGYAFIKALFPLTLPIKASEKTLDNIERAALSAGMSLALVPIIGLLLNYTPWGIRLTPVTLSLAVLTLAFAVAGLVREERAQKPATDVH